MKILVVEDEFNAREGIAALITEINSEHEICGKAADGMEGYEMAIKFNPDLIFVDIELPKLNGLQMIQKILEAVDLAQKPSFVILSGYAEFQYAQQAIKFGVKEYLLKPITYDRLKDVIQNLGRIHINSLSHNAKEIRQEQILSNILLAVENELSESLAFLKEIVVPEYINIISIYYGDNSDLNSLIKVVSSFCEYYNFTSCYPSNISSLKLYTFIINSRNKYKETVNELNYGLIYSLQKNGFENFIVTLLPIENFDQLIGMADEILNLSSWELTLGNEKVIYPELITEVKQVNDNKIRKYEIEALSLIKGRNIAGVLKINDALCSSLRTNKYNPEQIKKICTNYIFSILVYAKEFNTNIYEKVQSEQILDKLKHSITMREIKNCMNDLIKIVLQENKKCYSILVQKMLNHVRNSYMDKVSLEEIADELNVSPKYLSHLFTQEVGASFSDYLKNFRIDIAKRLMSSSKLKVYEIGEEIGYRDPKYFCKMFKEVTGLSPKEYMSHKY